MHQIEKKKIITLSLILIVIFIIFQPNRAAAQNKELQEIFKFIKKERVNAAYAIGGGNYLELSKLNTHLNDRGFPQVPLNYFSYGLGGHFINHKMVFGVELLFLNERTTTGHDDYNLSTSAKIMMLNIGHLVYWKKGLKMYPYLGAGYGKFKMITAQNNIDSFNDIGNLHKSSESRFSNMVLNLGFGTDYFLNYEPKKKGRNNIIIGFRVGVNFIPFKSTWKVNRIAVPDGPNIGINGPYIRIIIGLGGWAERFIKKAMR
jgi:hypothetical protein